MFEMVKTCKKKKIKVAIAAPRHEEKFFVI